MSLDSNFKYCFDCNAEVVKDSSLVQAGICEDGLIRCYCDHCADDAGLVLFDGSWIKKPTQVFNPRGEVIPTHIIEALENARQHLEIFDSSHVTAAKYCLDLAIADLHAFIQEVKSGIRI